MAHAADKNPERAPTGVQDRTPEQSAPLRTLKIQRYASRSDLFPRLTALQKALNARHFAIFRLGGTGVPNKRKLTQELENWGPSNTTNGALLLEAYGDILIEHVEQSLLPVMWNGRDDAQTAEAVDFSPFTTRLKGRILPFSGIGFPVRPGSIGNGYVVFTAPYLDLTGEAILDAHGRAAQVMIDLLQLEERRAAPSEALSEREIACLQLAGDGCISEEIADRLGLSVHTVNAYLGSATIKLNSVNRIQAIAKAIRLGFIG